MNKTIKYKLKGATYDINVSNPFTENLAIGVNGVLCNYVSPKVFIEQPDKELGRAINRYNAEKNIGLI